MSPRAGSATNRRKMQSVRGGEAGKGERDQIWVGHGWFAWTDYTQLHGGSLCEMHNAKSASHPLPYLPFRPPLPFTPATTKAGAGNLQAATD